MKKAAPTLIAFALVCGSAPSAEAQLYLSAQYSAPYVPQSSGTAINFVDPDEGSMLIPIGFPFTYYGQTYSFVNVGVNGALSFAATCSAADPCADFEEICNANNLCERESIAFGPSSGLPNADSPNLTIAPFWDDLIIETFFAPPSVIRYGVIGSAPNRELVVEWAAIRHYFFLGGTVSYTNFQVRLDEASGAIRLAYGPYSSNTFDDATWAGITGIENEDATEGIAPLPCSVGLQVCDYTTLQALQNQVIEFVIPNTPELVASVTPPTGADPGAQIAIAVEVRNIGPQATGSSFTADVYLSTDAVITPASDTKLGTVTFAAIAGSSVATETLVATLASTVTPGLYRIGAVIDADNDVAESIESNNVVVSSIVFLVGADVSVRIDPIPGTGPDEEVTFPLRLLNNGSAVADVAWEVHLSIDQQLGTGDILLASGTTSLAAVPETIVDVTATVPVLIPGDYYALARVDPMNLITEADELNNDDAAETVTSIRGADVVAANATGDFFVFRGETYRATITIANQGLSTAEGFYYSVHLSNNQLITFTDPLLGEIGPITLAPGERTTMTHDLPVSSTIAAGQYYLGLIADSRTVVLEELENNNVFHMRDAVTVRDPAPDLNAYGIVLPTDGAAGESLTIARVISNSGNADAAAVGYAIYLTADTDFDPMSDTQISSGMIALAARTDDRGIDRVRIPSSVAGGRYYVAYVLDPANTSAELFEDNNVGVSEGTIDVLPSQLSILTRMLPLATLELPYEFALAAAGGAGGYTWSVGGGALPMGLTLGPTGLISGTPVEAGLFTFTANVSDGALSAGDDLTILVAEQTLPLEIVTRSIVPAFVGRPYEYPLTGFGGVPPYVWSARDVLPAGLTLEPSGKITGTASMPGVATVNFHVEDAAGATADRPIVVRAINSDASIRFSNDVLPDGTLGEEYAESLHVEPGTGASPFTFELASGMLPPGLTLENDRVLGIPTAIGDFMFEVRLGDSRGDFDLNLFILTIREGSRVSISTTSLPTGLIDEPYLDESGLAVRVKAFSPNTTGGEITFTLLSGALPAGLTLAADGTIAGTPTAAGVSSFLVEARDAAGQTARAALGILIDEPEVVEPPVRPSGCSCATTESETARNNTGASSWWIAIALGVALAFTRRRAAVLVVLAIIAVPSLARAQSVPYFTSTRSEPYMQRSGGTPIIFEDPFFGPDNDDGIATVSIPFAFRFFDTDYSAVVACSNGWVSFISSTQSTSYTPEPIPTQGEPDGIIAMFWDDLIAGSGSSHVEGTAPNRVLILQYDSMTTFAAGGGTTQFQLWLYEGLAGRMEVHFGPSSNIAPGSWAGTSGFEDTAGLVGHYLMPCQTSCDGTDVSSANGTVFVAQQDAGDEIVAQAITAPAAVYPGIDFDVTLTLASQHQAALGPFVYEVQLVEQGQNLPGTTILRSAPVTLGPYQVLQVTTSTAIALDTTPGRYRLALIADADGDIAEPDESNNIVISTRDIRVDARQPDFTVSGVAPSVPSASPGESVTFTLDLSNSGNLDGTSAWSLYLSRNPVVSTDDLQLASGTEELPLLTTADLSVPVTLPASLAAGSYYVGAIADPENTVSELSEVNNTGVGSARIVISVGSVSIDTTSLPLGYQNVPYSTYFSASGGDGTYQWSVTNGAVPAGLALIPTTGELRGRPMAAAMTTFTVQVASGGDTASRELTLDIREIAGELTIVTRDLLPGIVGDSYPPAEPDTAPELQQHLVAVGGTGEVTFTLDGAAPPGLTLDGDGYLHGVPQTQGVFELHIVATDGTMTVSRAIPLTIAEPGRLTLVAAILPDAVVGEDYSYQLRAIGRSPTSTVTFSTEGGAPPGLSLTTAGQITGIPQIVGSWTFTVTVVEGSGMTAPRDTAAYRIVVGSDAGFRITPGSAPVAEVGTEYEVVFEAVEGTPPLVWRILGPSLPRGLITEVRTEEGREKLVVMGTPELEGVVTELVTVSDASGRRAEVAVSFQVLAKAAPPKPVDDGGCGCTAAGAGGSVPSDSGAPFVLVLAGVLAFAGRRFVSRGRARGR